MGCPLNQRVWPRVVGQDICRHLEHLRSQAVTLRGRAHGQILLPLPLCVERKDELQLRYHSMCVTPSSYHLTFNLFMNACVCACSSDSCLIDRTLLYSIETMVIQWCQLMGSVLQRDSSKLLREGDHPGPTAELSFWAKQKDNLLGIQKQVEMKCSINSCQS